MKKKKPEPKPCEGGCGRMCYPKYNSTIVPKFCPNCQFKEAVNQSKSKINKSETKPKTKSFDFYKTTAWQYFRKYVMLYYADNNNIVQCSTCGKYMQLPDKLAHCGHYVKVEDMSKSNYSVALEFHNVAPQCYQCNKFKSGDQINMRKFLVQKHGEEAVQLIEFKKHNNCKPDSIYLDYYKNIYKKKFTNLLATRRIMDPWKKKK